MSLKNSKRITESRLKTYARNLGIIGVPLVFILFAVLAQTKSIEVTGFKGDMRCGGDVLCFAELNVTFKNDVFIYPMNSTWMLKTENVSGQDVEWVKLYRTWGKGLREIKLNETCKGTWCGGKKGSSNNAYVFAFRKGKSYTLIFKAKKQSYSYIKWSFNPHGEWKPLNSMRIIKNCTNITVFWNETKYDKTTGKEIVQKSKIKKVCSKFEKLYVAGKIFEYSKQNYNCSIDFSGDFAVCDSCLDGNCDGICDPNGGESCVKIESSGIVKYKNSGFEYSNKLLPVKKLEVAK